MNNTTGQTPGITTASGAADLPEARLFTKKPVTIAAIQWTGKNLREVIALTDGTPDTRTMHAGMAWEAYTDLVARDGLKIYTLEGTMLASPGDWIIRGVKGEMYPCKDEIFEATYSPAALAAGQATAAQAGEYPALVCDYCGALTPDPWHSSGMLHGKMSKHIHSCDACAPHGQAPAGAAQAESVPAVSDLPPLPAPDLRDVGTKPQEIKEFLKGYATEYARTAIAARAPADSVQEDAARYRWLREGNDAKHGAAWHVAVNLYGCEWDAAIDAAMNKGASHDR